MRKIALQMACFMLTGLLGCASAERADAQRLSTLDIEAVQLLQFDEAFHIEATELLAEAYGDGFFFAQLTDFSMLEQFNADFAIYGISVEGDERLFDEHYLIVTGEAPLESIIYCVDGKTNKTLFHPYAGHSSTGMFFVYQSSKVKLDEYTDFH